MKAFLFDIDDTVYDQMQPFCSAFDKTFSGQYSLPFEGLFSAYRKCSDEVFEASENGLITMEQMYIYRLCKAMEMYGVEIAKEEALLFQDNYREAQNQITVSEDMKRIMEFCKDHKVKIGAISNGPARHQAGKVQRLGLIRWIPEQYIFISGAVGAMKPDREIFIYAEEVMQLSGKETYYIGDSFANDVVGAKRAGWNAVWFNRRGNQPTEQNIQPDHVVCDEKQLSRLIKSLID